MGRVIRHIVGIDPFTGESMGDGAVEFRLPIAPSDLERDEIPKAFAELQAMPPDAARDWYAEKYVAQTEAVARLASRISEYTPAALVEFEGSWFVRCCLGAPNDNAKSGDDFFLTTGHRSKQVKDVIGDFEPPSASFEEFMRMFPGLRKSWPGQSGAFIHDDFSRFAENIWLEGLVEEEVEEYGEWIDAVCLYDALNGDILLMQEDGRTGWFFHEESRAIRVGYESHRFFRELTLSS